MKILINFYADVSENSVNSLINFITQSLAQQNQQNPIDEIIIQISSFGGSSDHGLLAFNYLKQLNIKKTTIGMGNVDSAAVMIFCSGDTRLAMPSCRFTLHESLTTINGVFNAVKLREIAKLNERITTDYGDVVSRVTGEKKTKVNKYIAEGSVMSAEDAKRHNLVTSIQETPYLEALKDLNIFMINNPPVQPLLPNPAGGTVQF